MDSKDYNSQRSKLILPEYGRHIQKMVQALSSIKDRELRNQQAHAVIAVMGNINTHLRDTADFRHKLWDHLFIMSDFQLDVDSPYPIPSPEALTCHPQKLEYPKGNIEYKQYGKNIRNVIDLIKNTDDEDDKIYVASNIAKFMKVKSYEYNQEYPSNEVIINDIRKFSDNSITLDDDTLNSTKLAYNRGKTAQAKNNQNNNKKRNNNQRNNKRHNNLAQQTPSKQHYRANNRKK